MDEIPFLCGMAGLEGIDGDFFGLIGLDGVKDFAIGFLGGSQHRWGL